MNQSDLDVAPLSLKMKALLMIADKVRQDGRRVAEADVAQAWAAGVDDKAITQYGADCGGVLYV